MIMLLFNKDDRGSIELEDLTGQWYASSPYRAIRTEIDFAVREVQNRVGMEVMNLAAEAYQKGEDMELANAVRMPVAFLAIMRYAALSSVSHESTGRKVKMDDNEKMPFEWMVDRDDRAMRERYYRALDSLYSYLEENKVPEWMNSDVRSRVRRSIVRSLEEFEAVYPIEGSYYVYYMLQNLVIEEQDNELEQYFGGYWEDILAGSCKQPLQSLAVRAAVLSSVVMAGERWSLTVFPLEIAKRFSPTYQGNKSSEKASVAEVDWYLDKLRKQKAEVMNKIRAILSRGCGPVGRLLPKNDPKKKYCTTV